MARQTLPGINIQWPISADILSGKKKIETRTYKIPEKYINVKMALIETPGPKGKFKARIVGTIIFSSSFQYESKNAFYRDKKKHLVDERSPWAWSSEKPKWGWVIKEIHPFSNPITFVGRRGIVFSKSCIL